MMTEPARKTSLENKHLRNCDYFAIIPSSVFAFYNVNKEPCNWISLSAVKVNTQSHKFTIVSSSVHQDGKCGNFTLLIVLQRTARTSS